MNKGLVLEGGAMRGLFSAGVIDVMMEHGLRPDVVIGVSAGAAFGCNYKSGQIGRAIRYNKLMAKNRKYCSVATWIKTGNIFHADFAYHYVPDHIDIFDREAFNADPMKFYVVCTDVDTGEPVYKRLDTADYEALEWIRASASMPMFATIVDLEGRRLLDGGVADSIPLEQSQKLGYDRNVVVLTQPEGYVKRPNSMMPLFKVWLRRHPEFLKAMSDRHLMYNAQLEYVANAEREGTALVIRPPFKLPIHHLCHDPEQMQKVYDIGRATAEARIDEIKKFYSDENEI